MEGFHVTDVIHRAFVKVDEEGTEAGAASVIKAGKHGSGPVVFHVDRPFICAILSHPSRLALFVGLIVDPRATQ